MTIWHLGTTALRRLFDRPTTRAGSRRGYARRLSGEALESRRLLSISGYVYVDINGNGARDASDPVAKGVTLTLSGIDQQGNPIAAQATTTGADGSYQFATVLPGTYQIRQTQPLNLIDGQATPGSLGGLAGTNLISNIVVPQSSSGINYNFYELGLIPQLMSIELFLATTPSSQQIIDNVVGSAAALTVNLLAATGPINAANAANAAASGTGTVGATIGVVATDGVNTTAGAVTTVAADGTWTVTGIDARILNDGPITYVATAVNQTGQITQSSLATTKDATPPAVSVLAVTNPINEGNSTSTSASGTGEVGATISVVATDGVNTTAPLTTTVAANGGWTIVGIDVSNFNDGPITYIATATDAAGNFAQSNLSGVKDTSAPGVTITTSTNPINAENADNVSISGTASDGATVEVVASSGGTNVSMSVVAAGGTWTVSGLNLTALADGFVVFTVTATETSGNSSQTSTVVPKDTVPPAVALVTVTDPIGSGNQAAVAASGSGEAAVAISIVASDGENESQAVEGVVAGDGTWSLAGIDVSALDDGIVTFTVTARDAAGNTSTATLTAQKDTLAPAVELEQVTDPIGIANQAAVAASGTGEAGATISIVASDGENESQAVEGVVAGDGTWSLEGIDVSALADGTLTFTVTARDAAGNTATSSLTATKTTVAIGSVTDPINADNQTGVAISGTGEAGATITVTVSDGQDEINAGQTVVAGDGTWSLEGIDVSTLADGTLTFTATATEAGQQTAQSMLTAVKDTVAPQVALLEVTDPINALDQAAVAASGMGEAGATISIVASDGENESPAVEGVVAGDGTWSLTGIDVSALADGTLTFTVTARDAAGNTSTAMLTAEKDTVAPEVEVAELTDPIGIATADVVSISGTGEAGATISLVVSDGQNETDPIETAVAGDGTWSLEGIDVTFLNDGPLTFTVTARDAAGNTATATAMATKNTIAITLFTNPVNSANQTEVAISGTGEAGATVGVVINDGMNQIVAGATVVMGDGTWALSGIDVSTLNDGTLTFVAVATLSGKSVNSLATAAKDTAAPQVALLEVTDPINAANQAAVAASGTGEAGATISLVIGDGQTELDPIETTVAGDGTWALEGIDVSTLNDGPLTFTVTARDAAGNTSTAMLTAEKDTAAPQVALLEVTDPINALDQAAVAASGTGEAGATISLVVSDGQTELDPIETIVAGDGTWALEGMDVTLLNDGPLTFTVTARDAAGNTATTSLTAAKDTVAPELVLIAVTGPVNLGNQTATSVSGTGEPGATISVVAGDGTTELAAVETVVAGDGSWFVGGIDVTSLADGELTYTVTARDAAGNTVVDTITTLKDTVPPEVAIVDLTAAVNAGNQTATAISGTGEAGATISVEVSDGASETEPVETMVAGDGTWSIDGIDVSSLADGTLTYKVTAQDPAGNTTVVTQDVVKDTAPPAVQSIALADPDPTDLAMVAFTVTFSEEVSGVDVDDFELAITGDISGAAIVEVTGSGTTYTVVVSTGTGAGTLGLSLVDDDSITDLAGNPLGGEGLGNADFAGPSYTVVDGD